MLSSKPGGKRGPDSDDEPRVVEDEEDDFVFRRRGPNLLKVGISFGLSGEEMGLEIEGSRRGDLGLRWAVDGI